MLVHLKPTTKQSHIPFLHLFFLHLQETNSSTNSGAGFCLSHSTASASSFLSNHALLGLDDCCFPVHVSTHSFGNLPFPCEYIEHPVLEAAWNQHLQQAKKDAFTADGNIIFSSHVKKWPYSAPPKIDLESTEPVSDLPKEPMLVNMCLPKF